MWSFGSSQWGLFWYWGLQVEIQRYQPKRWGGLRDGASIYTGYVFNLWNSVDYTGAFSAINFPGGSFFFDPTRLISWPIHSFGNSTTLFGGNYTTYKQPIEAWEVPYGVLATDWTILQAAITAHFVLTYNKSAYVTAVGTAFTEAIAKSKQIYNGRNSVNGEDYHYLRTRNDNTRPEDWRSGPPNPLSRILGAIGF